MGSGTGTRNISLSGDAGLRLHEVDVKLQVNAPCASRAFDGLRLFRLLSAPGAQAACVTGEFLLH